MTPSNLAKAPQHARPTISVVVPTYQRADCLARTVQTLRAQTRRPLEIIVADDGSTDDTSRLMSSDAAAGVRYLRRGHLGMPGILNEGLAAASGDYVMVCHDHDIYAPTLLEDLAGALDRHPTALFAHCGVVGVDVSGERETEWYVRDYPELAAGGQFLVSEMLPRLHSPVAALAMIRRSVLDEGLLDAHFRGCADVELWLRLCARGDVAYVAKPLIRVRARDSQSAFHSAACQFAELVMEAKSRYLPLVQDERRRNAIRHGWQREVNVTALAQMLAMADRPASELATVADFVRRHGTPGGRALFVALRAVPRPLAIGTLRLGRSTWRAMRSLRRSESH